MKIVINTSKSYLEKIEDKTMEMYELQKLFFFISTLKGSGVSQRMKAQQVLLEYTKSQIAEHEKTFDENNLRDFIDVYIQAEKQDGESKGKGLLLKH